jgi:hypothetical protein
MKAIVAGLLAFACSAASASMDNPMVAAQEAGSGGYDPSSSGSGGGIAMLFGAIGAGWFWWGAKEDANAMTSAAVGAVIGSMVGFLVALALR